MLRLLLMSSILRAPAPDEGGEGGGEGAPDAGGADDAPKFTQKQVDAMMAKRVAGPTKQLEKMQASIAERDAKIAELEERATAPDPKAQREIARLQKERDDIAKERDEHRGARDAMTARERARASNLAARDALTAAGALDTAAGDAARSMLDGAETELDENGVVTVTIEGVPYSGKALEKYAKEWLAKRPYFAKSSPSGSGAGRPNGNAIPRGAPLSDLPTSTLLREGFKPRARS